MSSIIQLANDLCPPVIWRKLKRARVLLKQNLNKRKTTEGVQDLDPYYEEEFAQVLEHWGENNTWIEICMFLFQRRGKVLDIACGTGKPASIVKASNPDLDLHGCDISEFLIQKAVARGLPKEKFVVCDATDMSLFGENHFDYAYTIGSIEHFSEEGIAGLIAETHRVVRSTSFHFLPTARSGRDEGWIKVYQSLYNNSLQWWLDRFRKNFDRVLVFDSRWEDEISLGKWIVTVKEDP